VTNAFGYLFDSLATEADYVRRRLAQYAEDLLSLGADGLRLDAAKRVFFFSPSELILLMPAISHRHTRRRLHQHPWAPLQEALYHRRSDIQRGRAYNSSRISDSRRCAGVQVYVHSEGCVLEWRYCSVAELGQPRCVPFPFVRDESQKANLIALGR